MTKTSTQTEKNTTDVWTAQYQAECARSQIVKIEIFKFAIERKLLKSFGAPHPRMLTLTHTWGEIIAATPMASNNLGRSIYKSWIKSKASSSSNLIL